MFTRHLNVSLCFSFPSPPSFIARPQKYASSMKQQNSRPPQEKQLKVFNLLHHQLYCYNPYHQYCYNCDRHYPLSPPFFFFLPRLAPHFPPIFLDPSPILSIFCCRFLYYPQHHRHQHHAATTTTNAIIATIKHKMPLEGLKDFLVDKMVPNDGGSGMVVVYNLG